MAYNCQPFNTTAILPVKARVKAKLSESLKAPQAPMYFPRLAYNIQPFNRVMLLPQRDGAHLGANIYPNQLMVEILGGKLRLASGIAVTQAMREKLGGRAVTAGGIRVTQKVFEILSGAGHLGANINISTRFLERIKGHAALGANIYASDHLGEALGGMAQLSANLYVSQKLYEALNGYADSHNLTEYITRILDDIPPGATLVIDAESFNAALQQGHIITDVIDWHDGDWIWLSRNTVNITVSGSGGTAYEWEVFYNALYL